jgi:glycosyltransferase involved in cell wall biosynthesis
MKSNNQMKTSIILPTRNEAKYIRNTIESIMQALNENVIEILIVDGESSDATIPIIHALSKKYSIIKLLKNSNYTVPFALNKAIKESKGDYILRLDAHSTYPNDYINMCMKALRESGADNVGGVFQTEQNGESYSSKIVQMLTTHWFGVGDASYRLSPKSKYTDTVPYGFFKKSIFRQMGWFDERLTRNQDYEFNQRIRTMGGKIWMDPKIKVIYKNQSSIKGLLKQAFGNGKWNVWMWRIASYSFKLRHTVPGIFVLGIMILLILGFAYEYFALGLVISIYFITASIAAFQQAVRYRNYSIACLLPVYLFAYHLSYGTGTLYGVLTLLLGKSEVGKNTRPWQGATDYYSRNSILANK